MPIWQGESSAAGWARVSKNPNGENRCSNTARKSGKKGKDTKEMKERPPSTHSTGKNNKQLKRKWRLTVKGKPEKKRQLLANRIKEHKDEERIGKASHLTPQEKEGTNQSSRKGAPNSALETKKKRQCKRKQSEGGNGVFGKGMGVFFVFVIWGNTGKVVAGPSQQGQQII